MHTVDRSTRESRRRVLGLGVLAGASLVARPLAALAPAAPRPMPRRLAFHNTHTGEDVDVVYWSDGHYLPDALVQINQVLRDHRTEDVKAIDRRVLDLLFELRLKLETAAPYQIISGYRTPESNAYLRGLSPTSGVAKMSQHMLGRACDVRVRGRTIEQIRDAALSMRRGGVGYYPASDFVHVDVGRVRKW
jgi:uncharacterized protein YcbK (DUF882 family)